MKILWNGRVMPRAGRRFGPAMVGIVAVGLMTVAGANPALAATAKPGDPSPAFKACMKQSGGVTASLRACLNTEYRTLDRELNVTYKSVMKQLKTKDLRTRLVNSQRVWIWRRDDQCQRKVDESGMKGGTAGDLVYDDCRVTMVRERIRWLKKVPSNPGYLSKV